MSISTAIRKTTIAGTGAAAALLMSAGLAHAAVTVHGPGTGAEKTPPGSSDWFCGKVTEEPGNHAVEGAAVTVTLNTSPVTTRTATTDATGGYCIDGTGFAPQVLLFGRTVTISVDPSTVNGNTATYPNNGNPIGLAWFVANANGTNIESANIAYQ